MGIIDKIVEKVASTTIANNLDKPIDMLDKKIEKNRQKMFDVGKGKKALFIRQKLYTIRDYLNVYDENNIVKYKLKGEFISIKHHMHIYNIDNEEIGYVKEKILSFKNPLSFQTKPARFFFFANGKRIAKMKSKTVFKDKLVMDNGWVIKGNFSGFKYKIYNAYGKEIASVKSALFDYGDAYKVEYLEDIDELIILMIVIAIDMYIGD